MKHNIKCAQAIHLQLSIRLFHIQWANILNISFILNFRFYVNITRGTDFPKWGTLNLYSISNLVSSNTQVSSNDVNFDFISKAVTTTYRKIVVNLNSTCR